ncbi:MAG: methylated-DNA--[protein]-cysteine S-methyltransferase [Bacteroidales bacterium]|nr:methylated-DNA--[protein]-cysteine S-methyltransferase [Bacteroidales bacterium]
MSVNDILTVTYDSPCGRLLLGSFDGRLCLCDWFGGRPRVLSRLTRYLHADLRHGISDVTDEARRQLDLYFAGSSVSFDLPLLTVGTDMQHAVWQAIARVPRGDTITYAQLASSAGYPKAIRAAATATADNALSVIIPCHRIVSPGRQLLYAGGTEAKSHLLRLENSQCL